MVAACGLLDVTALGIFGDDFVQQFRIVTIVHVNEAPAFLQESSEVAALDLAERKDLCVFAGVF